MRNTKKKAVTHSAAAATGLSLAGDGGAALGAGTVTVDRLHRGWR